MNNAYIGYMTPLEMQYAIHNKYPPPSPPIIQSINIHHIRKNNHWLTSVYEHAASEIYIYDSLTMPSTMQELTQQLELLYGNSRNVQFVPVTQQGTDPACNLKGNKDQMLYIQQRNSAKKKLDDEILFSDRKNAIRGKKELNQRRTKRKSPSFKQKELKQKNNERNSLNFKKKELNQKRTRRQDPCYRQNENKQKRKRRSSSKYHSKEIVRDRIYKQKTKQNYAAKTVEELVKAFNLSLQHGCIYVCCSLRQPWFKESVVSASNTVRSLPRRTDDTNTTPLKLKRRLRYRSHYKYENIRPTKCVDAVNYLLTKDLFKKYVTDGFNDNWLQNSYINTEEHQNGEQVIEIPDQPIKKRTFPNNNRQEDEVWSEDDEIEKDNQPLGSMDTMLIDSDYTDDAKPKGKEKDLPEDNDDDNFEDDPYDTDDHNEGNASLNFDSDNEDAYTDIATCTQHLNNNDADIVEIIDQNNNEDQYVNYDIGPDLGIRQTKADVHLASGNGLVNGASCTTKYIEKGIIWVQFDNADCGRQLRLASRHLIKRNILQSWVPIKKVRREFSVGRYKNAKVSRYQYPLQMACAKTVHRSQEIPCNLQFYNYQPKITVSQDVKSEIGYKKDESISAPDVYLFVETKLCASDKNNLYEMENFNMYRNDYHNNRTAYGSSVYIKKTYTADEIPFNSKKVELTVVQIKEPYKFTIICVYCRPDENVLNIISSLNKLKEHIQSSHPIIIIGDCNSNMTPQSRKYLKIEKHMLNNHYGFHQIIKEHTTDGKTTIDLF
ncbi:unnamed protein product [Mytilus edulis]|uniref:Endonuclease/exonuclease/phosphatase domain-containing protein n=1 Tax=Mytilus edulis TaxID=6550 RepID=A0A8S3RQ85_MYTED|nr:unnamed protein product [Mytilus edulis]